MAKNLIFALIPCLVGGVLLWRRPTVEGERIQLLNVLKYNNSHAEEGYLPAESAPCVPAASPASAAQEMVQADESIQADVQPPKKRGPKRRPFEQVGHPVPIQNNKDG